MAPELLLVALYPAGTRLCSGCRASPLAFPTPPASRAESLGPWWHLAVPLACVWC